MSQKKIKICGTNVHPGEKANLALPLPEHYSCSPLFMPIKVIHGVKEGPCLVIFSVLKGTELNGLEISNRLINSINPKRSQWNHHYHSSDERIWFNSLPINLANRK